MIFVSVVRDRLAEQEDNRSRLAELVTCKLQDSFYVNVFWDAG
ncbi:hypothetical protein [Escherichia coli]|nr:hypothetical protein [Escherichia coli]